VADNRIGVSPGMVYDEIVGTDNTFDIFGYNSVYLRFRIKEAAWNPAHGDSVSGYEIQVRKTDRAGNASPWYDVYNRVPALQYSPSSSGINFVSIDVRYEDFYGALITPDKDGTAYFYSNGQSFFNDSCRFSIRVRPYIGQGQTANNQTGQWSNVLTYADNVAPCDSDFVTAQNCGMAYRGGIDVYDYVEWNNTQADTVRTGYISVGFPEDMDITGPAPKITLYYGTFAGNPPKDTIEIAVLGSRWSSARTYQCFLGIPPGDYTHANDSTGVYYNVSVAGCRDASGVVIQ
jgi:hypothetical protein